MPSLELGLLLPLSTRFLIQKPREEVTVHLCETYGKMLCEKQKRHLLSKF